MLGYISLECSRWYNNSLSYWILLVKETIHKSIRLVQHAYPIGHYKRLTYCTNTITLYVVILSPSGRNYSSTSYLNDRFRKNGGYPMLWNNWIICAIGRWPFKDWLMVISISFHNMAKAFTLTIDYKLYRLPLSQKYFNKIKSF